VNPVLFIIYVETAVLYNDIVPDNRLISRDSVSGIPLVEYNSPLTVEFDDIVEYLKVVNMSQVYSVIAVIVDAVVEISGIDIDRFNGVTEFNENPVG